MTKPNKKKLIFIGIAVIALIAIVAFTYLFLIGRSFYKLKGIEKDSVDSIIINKIYPSDSKDGEKPKKNIETKTYERDGINSDEFNKINDMMSELKLAKSFSKKWRLSNLKIGSSPEGTLYTGTVVSKAWLRDELYFFEDDVNKINTELLLNIKLYHKGITSELDLKKYFTEVE